VGGELVEQRPEPVRNRQGQDAGTARDEAAATCPAASAAPAASGIPGSSSVPDMVAPPGVRDAAPRGPAVRRTVVPIGSAKTRLIAFGQRW